MEQDAYRLKTGLAEMLKGGVIMDVTTSEQARIAQQAGACAVMALERVPADIRKAGGVARMADPAMIRTKGEPGTGNVVEAVRHCRALMGEIRTLCALPIEEVAGFAKEIGASLELALPTRAADGLPVAVRQGSLLATSFHLERTDDIRLHVCFLDLIRHG